MIYVLDHSGSRRLEPFSSKEYPTRSRPPQKSLNILFLPIFMGFPHRSRIPCYWTNSSLALVLQLKIMPSTHSHHPRVNPLFRRPDACTNPAHFIATAEDVKIQTNICLHCCFACVFLRCVRWLLYDATWPQLPQLPRTVRCWEASRFFCASEELQEAAAPRSSSFTTLSRTVFQKNCETNCLRNFRSRKFFVWCSMASNNTHWTNVDSVEC